MKFKTTNKTFYEKSLKEFGISAQGVSWNSKYTQYKRFEVITKLIKKDIKTSFLVDVGCGFGEYYHYLKNNHREPQKFIGIDCEQTMIDISQVRFPQIEFVVKDVLQDELFVADYYTCSGAMNIMDYDDIVIFIQKCFYASQKGFLFNFLKNLSFNNIKQYEILDICKQYTKDIKIKENYLENDFTIFMVK